MKTRNSTLSWATKTGQVLALVVAFALFAAACGGSDATDTAEAGGSTGSEAADCSVDSLELVNAGQLTPATGEPAFPPYVVDDDPSNQQGFESAVVYAVAEELGFSADQVNWVRAGFDESIAPGDKDFDFNIQQYTITAERDEVVDFSVSYYDNEQAVVAAPGSPAEGVTTVEGLADVQLGASIGTTALDYIENVIEPSSQANVYDEFAAVNAAFGAGQIDAFITDLPTAFYLTAVEFDDASIIGVLPLDGSATDEFGMLFAEGNTLATCISGALDTLRDNGTLSSIEDQWLTNGGSIPTLDQ